MNTLTAAKPELIAAEVLDALSCGGHIPPFSERTVDFDLRAAYAATAALRRLRQARGERPVGRKIGFTNRGIWAQYNVSAPIWGDMFDTTVHELADLPGPFALAGLAEPQIEPEIAFKLGAAPQLGMDEDALARCIEWVAHGFEVVQSPYPGWRFALPDSITAGGLHGALLLGPRVEMSALTVADWRRGLAACEVELSRNGDVVDRGRGANVLDNPLSALRHLVALLADDPDNPPLAAGEIVTTGTMTRAFPIGPGERWSTRIEGLPLSGIAVSFG
jgi:2-oxo-3-hexenedioate decarboxylase